MRTTAPKLASRLHTKALPSWSSSPKRESSHSDYFCATSNQV
jgi:hypothetical protein